MVACDRFSAAISVRRAGAWYTQLWIVEPATLDHDLLALQSDINVLCQRLAGRENAASMSIKVTNGPWGPSLALTKTATLRPSRPPRWPLDFAFRSDGRQRLCGRAVSPL